MSRHDRSVTVFFEVYSPVQVLLAAGSVRRARRIVIGRRTPFEPPHARAKRMALALVRLLNPSADVRELAVHDLLDYLPLNAKAVDIVAGLSGALTRTATYRRMRALVGDDDLVRYYQAAIVRHAANWELFPAAADRLASDGLVLAVPEWDTGAMHVRHAGRRALSLGAPVAWRRIAMRVASLVQALAVPLAVLLRVLPNGVRRQPPARYALAMPVWWGIDEEEGTHADVRRPQSDAHVYGGAFAPGDVVHVFGDLSFPAAQASRFERTMHTRGYAFVHKRSFKADGRLIRAAARAFRTALSLPFRGKPDALDDLVLRETPKALYHYLRKHLEYANVRPQAELVRSDYNPGHVIASIVSRQHNVRTVGVQHNVLPYEGPQVAFVRVDDLCVFGEFYRRGFAPHWDRLALHLIGRESLDWTLAVSQPLAMADLQRRWKERGGGENPMVLVVLPDDREICVPGQWNELRRALTEIAESPRGVDVVIRFRDRKSALGANGRPFTALCERDRRFTAIWKEFTTFELMALSDVVISHDGSFTVNEAVALGVPTFTFEFVCAGRYYFRNYGKDFVLHSSADVVRVVDGIRSGFAGFDCDWRGLVRDLNAYADGRNCARLRAVLEEAAGVSAPAPAARTAQAAAH